MYYLGPFSHSYEVVLKVYVNISQHFVRLRPTLCQLARPVLKNHWSIKIPFIFLMAWNNVFESNSWVFHLRIISNPSQCKKKSLLKKMLTHFLFTSSVKMHKNTVKLVFSRFSLNLKPQNMVKQKIMRLNRNFRQFWEDFWDFYLALLESWNIF